MKDQGGHNTATHTKDVPLLRLSVTMQRDTIWACSNERKSTLCLLSSSSEESTKLREDGCTKTHTFCSSTSKHLIPACWKDTLHIPWAQRAALRREKLLIKQFFTHTFGLWAVWDNYFLCLHVRLQSAYLASYCSHKCLFIDKVCMQCHTLLPFLFWVLYSKLLT